MRLTNPEELAEQGRFLEAAKAYREKALREKDVHKRRRFLNFAGRYYESAEEFSLSAKSFLESGDVDRALESSVKSGNPKVLSNALTETEHKQEETVELLLKCALQLVEQKEFVKARTFAKEALEINRSRLTEAMISMIDGVLEGKSAKVASSVKATQFLGEDDSLAREINFVANKFLANMPKIESEAKEPPIQCPECGAPLPLKRKGKFIECEYCGFPVRLD
jgi:DNA-directed RNA polymerase subunit RPC12/RpoP